MFSNTQYTNTVLKHSLINTHPECSFYLSEKSDCEITQYIRECRRAHTQIAIMVISEEDAALEKIEKTLANHYAMIHASANNNKTAHTYIQTAPDLLFLDIASPEISLPLLEKILKLDHDAYIVMLGSNNDRENTMLAMKLGAKGFISKPLCYEQMIQYIQRCPIRRKGL